MTDDPKTKRMLYILAEVERGHKKRIEQIYKEYALTENWWLNAKHGTGTTPRPARRCDDES